MNKESVLEQNINMAPIRIELELTELCNLKCEFCYNSQKPLVSKVSEQILERLADEGVMEIVLTGGEPLTHPDFFTLLEKSSVLFPKVMIQTNGTFITKKHIEEFKKNEVSAINISLHGPEKIHEKLTGIEGSFSKAVEGLKLVINSKINIASNFVLTKYNIPYIGEFIDYLYELGLKEMTLTRFTPTGIGEIQGENLKPCVDEINYALQVSKSKMIQYKDFHIILANSMPLCSLRDELSSFCSYCHFGGSRFYVDINGNVLMCGMERLPLGNILKNDFKTMKKQSDIYRKHILGEDVPDECKDCDDFPFCRGGCRAAAHAVTGCYSGKDPYMK